MVETFRHFQSSRLAVSKLKSEVAESLWETRSLKHVVQSEQDNATIATLKYERLMVCSFICLTLYLLGPLVGAGLFNRVRKRGRDDMLRMVLFETGQTIIHGIELNQLRYSKALWF